jgi:simple sugar transport system ATP-binding protein
VNNATFEVRSGEILAVAGVQGNGQTELVEALTGLRLVDSGTVALEKKPLHTGSPREIAMAGVAHIPEDRNRDGMVKGMTIAENYILNTYHLPQYSKNGLLNRKAIAAATEQAVKDFDVRTPSINTDIASLSGGNQQKVIVAREFSRNVRLVIAAQPTRGLDVGSIEYIHRRIVEQRDAGAAVLIVSTELDEVLALGDRVAVMYEGRIVGILDAKEATRERVGLLMGGITK